MSDEPVIKRAYGFKCQHNKFLYDPKLAYVECGICKEKLNPIWVIEQLSSREARANMQLDGINKQVEKAKKKNRCKCEHCGKLTRIQK
jgi:hypothetical protein